MTITEISKLLGISANTLRYYERIGLIPKVNRDKRGFRDYTEGDLRWIEFSPCGYVRTTRTNTPITANTAPHTGMNGKRRSIARHSFRSTASRLMTLADAWR